MEPSARWRGLASLVLTVTAAWLNRAQLAYLRGLALNASGTLYFADVFSHHIARSTPMGPSVGGGGMGNRAIPGRGPATSEQLYRPQGVAVDRTRGNLYIARLRELDGDA